MRFSPSGQVISLREGTDGVESHTLGINLGPVYNLRVGESIFLFGSPEIGLNWTYRGFKGSGSWDKPEISFPTIVVGARVFIAQNWAGVIQIQYARTTNYLSQDSRNNSSVSLGLGFAVFL
jgi:hypothetical protein